MIAEAISYTNTGTVTVEDGVLVAPFANVLIASAGADRREYTADRRRRCIQASEGAGVCENAATAIA